MRVALRRILFLARTEVLHVVRDRAMLVQIIVMPVVQLLILAPVATFAIHDSPAYVVDFDRTPVSRGLVRRLAGSGYFGIIGQSASPDSANDALLSGRATLVVTIPHDFQASLVRTGAAPVQLDVNAEKGTAAGIVQSYAAQILDAYARELSPRIHATIAAVRASPGTDPVPARGVPRIELRRRGWYNPGLDYVYYMVPGILVQLVTMMGTLLTAQNIAREKEVGTLEQLNVTPITRGQFIVAKLLPFWVLALFDLALGLAVGIAVYHIPVLGHPLLLFVAAAIYLLSALGIGLYISAIVDTQQQAMFVSFFVLMVYLLMSGLFTPIDSMPHWVQLLSQLNPMRHFITISRGVLLEGAGLREVAVPFAILVVYAPVVLLLAVRRYAKRAS